MERFYAFLPSVLLLALLALVTHLYLKWVSRRYAANLNSISWHQKNLWKSTWMFSIPSLYLYAPSSEELAFRVPIIILFASVSHEAWYGIFASSGIFALIHWRGTKINAGQILAARKAGEHASDDFKSEEERLYRQSGNEIFWRKVSHVSFTMILGILCGYYGITYQSVWVAFGIHMAWNVFMPILFPLAILLPMLLWSLARLGVYKLLDVWDMRTWRWRGRRRTW